MSVADSYQSAFAARPAGAEPAWLGQRRRRAIESFRRTGFPTRRSEAWRFSDLAPLTGQAFPPLAGGAASPSLESLVAAHRIADATNLVLVNGALAAGLSDALPAGAASLAAAPDQAAFAEEGESGPAALNAAFSADGVVLHVAAAAALERVLHLIHVTSAENAASFHVRHLVTLGAGARARLVETHLAVAGSRHWSSEVTAIRLDARAELLHAKLLGGADSLIHLAEQSVHVGEHARYEGFFLGLGGRLARQDLTVRLGHKADCVVGGLFLLRGEEEAALASTIHHDSPGGTTREIFKSVLYDSAHAIFQGCIRVAPDAQKTNAHQLSQTLLLSERARVDTKPELEILADDVKCSHGATVGALAEDQLFYLISRGSPEAEARAMLVTAFAASALDTVSDETMRRTLAAALEGWLGRRL
jgi:Fe-S cluster assembly protein SufD